MQPQAAIETSRLYHDLNGLSKLRGEVGDAVAIKEAAKQFESVFYSMMLKSMREAAKAMSPDPMFQSPSMDLFQDMYDKQLSVELGTSSEGALGLADILVDQLTGTSMATNSVTKKQTNMPDFVNQRITPAAERLTQLKTKQVTSTEIKTNVVNENTTKQISPSMQTAEQTSTIAIDNKSIQITEKGVDYSSPAAFVQSLLPYAQKFARKLDVDPKVLLAQAALETGWGKYVMRTAEGLSSHNVFGIKADKNWQGEQSSMQTLEFEAGQLRQKIEPFKAYENPAAAFADYVELISSKPRYDQALKAAATPVQYLQKLQQAGYATDPNYADKIYQIYHSETLNGAVQAVQQPTMRSEP